MPEAFLETVALSRRFGGLLAVDAVDFQVESGAIHGLIGPNGAGKTTLLNLIAGALSVTRGALRFRGTDITRWDAARRAHAGIRRTFQNLKLFAEMTGLENASLGLHAGTRSGIFAALARTPGQRREEREIAQAALRALEFVGLAAQAHVAAAKLPYGYRRLLEIARAMVAQPALLLLDEPAAGLTAGSSRRARQPRSSAALKSSKPILEARMLSLKGVDAGYDDALTLRGVSLEVERGEIVAMIGANGAGKSTTLRTICGFLRPRKGSIEFDGRPIAGLTPDRIAALGLVHVPEGRRVFPELTVEENLLAAAYLLRDRKEVQRRLAETMERFALLRQRRKQAAGTLSGGEQQMLAFGRAMMTGPKLLLLDEPSLGLAPLLVAEVMRSVKMFRDAGITVLLVEQNANLALQLADRGYVMETGAIRMQGSGAELLANKHVRASYLGYRTN